MVTKYLEGTRYLTNEAINNEGGNILIDYYLAKNEEQNYVTYGIEVLTKKVSGTKEVIVEEEKVQCISETYDEAKNIIDKLISYSVTPISLVEVIDEVISIA